MVIIIGEVVKAPSPGDNFGVCVRERERGGGEERGEILLILLLDTLSSLHGSSKFKTNYQFCVTLFIELPQ